MGAGVGSGGYDVSDVSIGAGDCKTPGPWSMG